MLIVCEHTVHKLIPVIVGRARLSFSVRGLTECVNTSNGCRFEVEVQVETVTVSVRYFLVGPPN